MELCGRKLEADMFVLDTGGYDVILGMTWLSKYHAVIDCRNKKVIFRILQQLEFQFIGKRKSLRKEDQLDCATAEDKKKGVSAWKEFLDVFEDTSGLPPDRVMEFSIDIVPRTTPISEAQYQMALIKLAILKEQLQKYSNKGLIRPSYFTLGSTGVISKQ